MLLIAVSYWWCASNLRAKLDTTVINIVDTVDCVAANHAYLKTPYSSKSELKNVCAISSNYLRKKNKHERHVSKLYILL